MAAYPPEWQIHGALEYECFHLAAGVDQVMGMTVLAEVDLEGHLLGTFRCALSGAGPITVKIPATKVFPDPPAHIKRMVFEVSADAGEMTPPNNTTSTPWKDWSASIKDRTIIPLDAEGTALEPEPVLKYLQELAAKDKPAGASSRWAIGATPSTFPVSLQMEFQVLPAPAKSLTKSNLRVDNCVSVQLARTPLRVDLFDGKVAAGPVPTLFAANQDVAFTGLMNNAEVTLVDLMKMNARFLFLEHISLGDAIIYLQGHAKKAKGIPAFPAPKQSGAPLSKKPRTEEATISNQQASETGELLLRLQISSVPDLDPPGSGIIWPQGSGSGSEIINLGSGSVFPLSQTTPRNML